MSIIKDICEYAYNTPFDSIPNEVRYMSKMLIADQIGCMVAGSFEQTSSAIHKYLEHKKHIDSEDMAFCYGYFSHALDFDSASNLIGHHASVVASALLACCNEKDVSGKEFLRAFCISTQVSFKIAEVLAPALNYRGFHITPVYGVIGATVAVGLILGLSEDEMVRALSLRVSHCSGLMGQFGTLAKFYHCGMAASSAIMACERAKAGFCGSMDIFERKNGFFFAYAGVENIDFIDFSSSWAIKSHNFLIKLYPCCSAAHSALNALEWLMKSENFKHSDVLKITTQVPEYTLHNLIYKEPKNAEEARFSMNFSLACLLVNESLTLQSYTMQNLQNPHILELQKKIEMCADDQFENFLDAEPSLVIVELKDGRKLTHCKPFAKGRTLDSPCDCEEFFEKFNSCVGSYVEDSEALFEILMQLELRGMRELELQDKINFLRSSTAL